MTIQRLRNWRRLALAAPGILAAGWVWLYLPYRNDLAAAQRRLSRLDRTAAASPCGPIEYAVRGAGYPVLVVHGIAGGFDHGLDLAAQHLGPNFTTIALSRFGYGGTPLPDAATPAAQADAYACLLDALQIKRAAIIAYSAGGTSALQFALRHPERTAALVLVSSAAPTDDAAALPPAPVIRTLFNSDAAFWFLITHLPSLMTPVFGVPRDYPLTPEEANSVAATMRSVLPVSIRTEGVMFDMYESNRDMAMNRSAYAIEGLVVPTLVVNAVDDPLATYAAARAMSERIPNARLLTVPQGGHLLLGATSLVQTEITGFLKEQFLRGSLP